MKSDGFSEFRHDAVHDLMRLNDLCEKEFHISAWPRWDYDLDRATLTFSEDGFPRVSASIQVVGTTSLSSGTWMWGWANQSLPLKVTKDLAKVREFGRVQEVTELIEATLPDDEHLGWAMTAVAAKLLGAKGGYRCPGENGFIYFIYSSIWFAASEKESVNGPKQVECTDHGAGFATYVCEHLASNPAQEWFSRVPDEEHKWPDAWCEACDGFFQDQGEWNEKNRSKTKINLLCHHCYERLRSQGTFSESEN